MSRLPDETIETIRKNARLVVENYGPISGLASRFGYNRESLAWVDDLIERGRPTIDERLVEALGSFAGECIIRAFGGSWGESEGSFGVFWDGGVAVFPFTKLRKQIKNGHASGETILGMFDLIEPIILKKLP